MGALRRMSSGATAAAFLPFVNFVSIPLSFFHEHVLLCRSDLAAMLGRHLFRTCQPPLTRHLFGTCPPRLTAPPPASSRTSTSFPPFSHCHQARRRFWEALASVRGQGPAADDHAGGEYEGAVRQK